MSEEAPELVFGLVGPIGVDMNAVQDALQLALQSVNYTTHTVHVSSDMAELDAYSEDQELATRFERKIRAANLLCRNHGADVLARLSIARIRNIRQAQQSKKESGETIEVIKSQLSANAFIIRQLKRPEEVKLLRKTYDRKFVQISVTMPEDGRLDALKTRLSADEPQVPDFEETARKLIAIDRDEDTPEGQNVAKAFHTGDVFINAKSHDEIRKTIDRFIRAFFGHNHIGPSKDEFGAYLAKTAALRTVDLSRQVGAAITTRHGDVLSLGCNEVPKYGGGNYWDDDDEKARDIDRPAEGNKAEIQRITVDFLTRLENAELLVHGQTTNSIIEEHRDLINDAMISDITEYGRMTHAEMSAICEAAKNGHNLKGATMHVTTFPCHNCAKHIVTSGILRVVFIEPYAKSRADRLHSDSISINQQQDDKVSFEHFAGISPRRYRDIFEKGKRRDSNGAIQTWYEGKPLPRILDRSPSHINKEFYALVDLPK